MKLLSITKFLEKPEKEKCLLFRQDSRYNSLIYDYKLLLTPEGSKFYEELTDNWEKKERHLLKESEIDLDAIVYEEAQEYFTYMDNAYDYLKNAKLFNFREILEIYPESVFKELNIIQIATYYLCDEVLNFINKFIEILLIK